MQTLLSANELCAYYGLRPVLNRLCFSVPEGGIVALLGANGAGKTSVLRAISGMIRASGAIIFDGDHITAKKTEDIARGGIAHVPDGRGTFNGFTVEENLRLGALIRDDDGIAADLERVYEYFPKLNERREQQAGTLSGGEQQMLAIARALMARPRLLLLDEPSFGLAPLVVQDLFRILRRINEEDGISMLLVEQNVSLALDLATHFYLLETGNFVLQGSSDDLRTADAVRRSYLGY
jgi:branched-chain amino acid transport system ATP-binding protein